MKHKKKTNRNTKTHSADLRVFTDIESQFK